MRNTCGVGPQDPGGCAASGGAAGAPNSEVAYKALSEEISPDVELPEAQDTGEV